MIRRIFYVAMMMTLPLVAMDQDKSSSSETDIESEDDEEEEEDKDEDQDDEAENQASDDDEQQPKESMGITAGQAKAFLLAQDQKTIWAEDDVCCKSWLVAGPSWALGVIGSVLSGLYCQNYVWRKACSDHCSLGDRGNRCDLNNNCYSSLWQCQEACERNMQPTLNDPVCRTGGAFIIIPVGLTILASFSGLINQYRTKKIIKNNAKIKNQIDVRYGYYKDNDEILAEDMFYIGERLLACNAPLLEELSPKQALMLALIDLPKFKNLADNTFVGETKTVVRKLLLMLEAEKEDLAEALKSKSVIEYFTSEPLLLEILIKTLPKSTLHDEKVENALIANLRIITGKNVDEDHEYYQKALSKIAQGTTIKQYFPSRVDIGNKSFTLAVDDQKIILDWENLKSVSEYFQDLLDDLPQSEKDYFEIPKAVPEEWVRVLMLVTENREPQINQKNFLTLLGAANYFSMKNLTNKCEIFLLMNFDLMASFTKQWHEDSGEKENSDAWLAQWRFLEQNNLQAAQKKLAQRQLKELNNSHGTTINKNLKNRLKKLNAAHCDDKDGSELLNIQRDLAITIS